jgi:hypothetical protein
VVKPATGPSPAGVVAPPERAETVVVTPSPSPRP